MRKAKDVRVMCAFAEMVDPSGLKKNPLNPNKHPEKQVTLLARAIEKFGWRHPVVVSRRSGFIVAGHGRAMAAQRLGCLVPVDYQDFETESEELAVCLSDNALQELSEIDEALRDEARGKLLDVDCDLEMLGFEALEKPKASSEDCARGYGVVYKVLVTCADEREQVSLIQKLEKEGRTCQPLIL